MIPCVSLRVSLHVPSENNVRRVVVCVDSSHLASLADALAATLQPPLPALKHWLHTAAKAAAAAPPIGAWPSSGQAVPTEEAASPADHHGLFPHQRRTLAWMATREAAPSLTVTLPGLRLPGCPPPPEHGVSVTLPAAGIIGHPVGSGKTRIVLTLAVITGSPQTLVLVPPHLRAQWLDEAAALSGDACRHITVVPFDALLPAHEGGEQGDAAVRIPQQRMWARIVIDEPQHLSKAHHWALKAFTRRTSFGFLWVLCGTAQRQLRSCATAAWGGELPSWMFGRQEEVAMDVGEAHGRSSQTRLTQPPRTVACPHLEMGRVGVFERIASAFVATCCVADAAADCLPVPPVRQILRPVVLPMASAMLVQAYTREGELRKAVCICNGVDVAALAYTRDEVRRGRPIEDRHRPRADRPRLRLAEEWDREVEARWRLDLEEARPLRDQALAEANGAHATFLGRLGLRCACPADAFWHCRGVPIASEADGGEGESARTGAATDAELQSVVEHDDTQGVSDALREDFGRAQQRVQRLEGHLRWSSNAKDVLTSPDATCGVCLDSLFDKTVAMWRASPHPPRVELPRTPSLPGSHVCPTQGARPTPCPLRRLRH